MENTKNIELADNLVKIATILRTMDLEHLLEVEKKYER